MSAIDRHSKVLQSTNFGAPIQMYLVLIPAYKPGPDFPQFIAELIGLGVRQIVVVDDGSGPGYRPRFEETARFPEVRIFRHAVNLGKGAALKTGMNAVLCQCPSVTAVVTADADGQHSPEDVLAVARFVEEHPCTLVLGARAFGSDVPLRSRFGNEATRRVMGLVVQRLPMATAYVAFQDHFLPVF